MKIVAVKFKEVGKRYYFNANNLQLAINDQVVVETSRGLELATVVSEVVENADFNEVDMKPIVRIALADDLKKFEQNIILAGQSFERFKQILEKYQLDMRPVACEYTLDQSKVIFMYISNERVDFRELLKELAVEFKCRIELKQIGARDKAKIVGGLGPCGMEICCARFLNEFDNISINLAKNQMLALATNKISGVCGRLLCCLKYEDEAYRTEKLNYPNIGSRVQYQDETLKVTGINIIARSVKLEGNNKVQFVPVGEVVWSK